MQRAVHKNFFQSLLKRSGQTAIRVVLLAPVLLTVVAITGALVITTALAITSSMQFQGEQPQTDLKTSTITLQGYEPVTVQEDPKCDPAADPACSDTGTGYSFNQDFWLKPGDHGIAVIESPTGEVTKHGYTCSESGNVTLTDAKLDEAGNVAETTDPLGNATQYGYDANGNMIAKTNPEGWTERYEYDDIGNRIGKIDPLGNRTNYAYDSLNRLVSETGPTGATKGYEYGEGNKPSAITDCWGNRFDIKVDQLEDGGKIINRTGPDGAMQYIYDANNNMTEIAKNGETLGTFDYDGAGRVIRRTDPDGVVTNYTYDANGRTVVEERLGLLTTSYYDAAGRLIRRKEGGSGRVTDYIYDRAGRLTREVSDDASKSMSYAYDPAGRRISKTDANGTAQYEYDAAGNRIAETSPGGNRQEFNIDRAGRRVNKIKLKYEADDQADLSSGKTEEALSYSFGSFDPTTYLRPMEIGPRSKVGTESAGSKLVKAGLGKALGSFLGGGGGGGGKGQSGPRIYKDPAKKVEPVAMTNEFAGTTIHLRPFMHKKDGLMVSTDIDENDEKGTFQTAFLVDEGGHIYVPQEIQVYEIWAKHKLTVTWTRREYVDGNLVSETSGGWSESWMEKLGTFTQTKEGTVMQLPAIWQLAGYDRAHAGVRRMGTYFGINKESLAAYPGRLFFVVHITRPKQDPVNTVGFVSELLRGEDGGLSLKPVGTTPQQAYDAPIFADGFESGDVSRWSSTASDAPYLPPNPYQPITDTSAFATCP